jgi:hypothetical protein
MLGGLLPTFVNLFSPTLADVPGRLVLFIIGSVLVFLVAVGVSPETRGNIDREAAVAEIDPPATVASAREHDQR